MATVYDVANFFLSQPRPDWSWSITHLKLQKLVYYAQAWSLALRNEELFSEDFEAWAHGPVSPKLYYRYRQYYYNEIPQIELEEVNGIDADSLELMSAVWNVYGDKTARDLEQRTHEEEPWQAARQGVRAGQPSTHIINKESMRGFYTQLLSAGE